MTQYVKGGSSSRSIPAARWGVRDLRRRPPSSLVSGLYEIKSFTDDEVVNTTYADFEWEIPPDLDGTNLIFCRIFVSTVSSSGAVTCQLRNDRWAGGTVTMLSTALTIDAGEKSSFSAATPPIIDTANDGVAEGDHIRLDVTGAGTGAKGLGLIARFETPESP